jgi:N-acyl-D-aspartate/D-glutamate deacylase
VLDLVIRGGLLVDGTGRPRRPGDIGIRSGRIVQVGSVADSARQVLHADGRVVAPGFVDIHTHFDAQAFWDPFLSPSPLHGVTSVVGGNCGFSIAPLARDSADYLMRLLARVEGMPLESLEAGVPWDWTSTAEYLTRLEGGLAVNAGFMVGHSAVRRVVMGEAARERVATSNELLAMQDLLAEGLAAGGMGFSSSHGPVHTDGDGQPVPSRHADDAELIALSGVCARVPGTSVEFIPGRHDDRYQELMIRMSLAACRPLNWNVMSVSAATIDECRRKLRVGSLAQERGARVLGLVIPRASRSSRTFRTGFIMDSFPGWAEAMALPPEQKLAVLRDPKERRRLEALAEGEHLLSSFANWGGSWIVETFNDENKKYEGSLVSDIAREQGKAPFDALLDIVCADELRTAFGTFIPDETPEDWQATAEILTDPRVIIGGSDAGAHLDGLATFNYTTNLLHYLVREQGLLSLEEAIHRITDVPARLYGLRDRGRIAVGAWADLVVLDPETVESEPALSRYDLPAGAGRMYAAAKGIDQVLVNGVQIVECGAFTGALPGALLRSGDIQNPDREVR